MQSYSISTDDPPCLGSLDTLASLSVMLNIHVCHFSNNTEHFHVPADMLKKQENFACVQHIIALEKRSFLESFFGAHFTG